MANKTLFAKIIGKLAPQTNAVNEAGGTAYVMTPKQELAQYAATGCLNGTFYASADTQLARVLELAASVEAEFIARTAIYARERAFMKDMPALLCAILAARDSALLEAIFPRVIDNGRMLRNFVQIVRSGVTGRKSLGTAPKRMIVNWIEARGDEGLFRDSVGNDPSLADVIRMVHPKPKTKQRAALYGYLIGRPYDMEQLPPVVRAYEQYKRGESQEVPNVPFQMLTSLQLSDAAWKEIAKNASWQMTRMNLNTFDRHCILADDEIAKIVATRIADRDEIRGARAFPYQLMAAYMAAESNAPLIVTEALQDAMEVAIENVPRFEGKVFVCPDVSGSMSSPVTGNRRGATSKVRCIDVAALVAAAVLRKNATAEVLPFSTHIENVTLNPRDSVMTNAKKLASIGGGGTSCSAPLAQLNAYGTKGDVVILVSDNESWADAASGRGTKMMKHWNIFKKNNPKAKLVCIDIQPYGTTQAAEGGDVLNIGGFSDAVFDVIADFAAGRLSANHWVDVIAQVALQESAA